MSGLGFILKADGMTKLPFTFQRPLSPVYRPPFSKNRGGVSFKNFSIWIVSLTAGALVSYFVFPSGGRTLLKPLEKNTAQLPAGEFTIEHPLAAKYIPAIDRSSDMQMFDKAALFLMDAQDADGHWDSARTLASPEFQNVNGDIALTGIAAYVLMCTNTPATPNPEAVARGGKAMRWLESKLNADGSVGQSNGPGEQTVAQLMAGAAFMQAASMSTREELRQTAGKLMNVALLHMQAQNGGYGPSPNSAEPRADVLGLAAFVYKSASLDGYQFDGSKPEDDVTRSARAKAQRAIEEQIVNSLRAGFKRLEIPAQSGDPKKGSGVFSNTPGGPPEWNATVACLLANFLINPQRSSVNPALDFVFGTFDAKAEGYPRIPETMRWGVKGEGYNAISTWFGTMAVVYLFTDDKYQHRSWTVTLREILQSKQAPDGGWTVAGDDALRGRVWRTALHAMTLILIAPMPPPPAPPADTINTPAVPVK